MKWKKDKGKILTCILPEKGPVLDKIASNKVFNSRKKNHKKRHF